MHHKSLVFKLNKVLKIKWDRVITPFIYTGGRRPRKILQISGRPYFRIGIAHSPRQAPQQLAIFVRPKPQCCMILVLLSLVGFFGIFFWQAERLNHMAEKKHIDHPENPYLWPQKVSKHA
jgi:hypothetical protein